MSHRYYINKFHATNYRIDLEGNGLSGKINVVIEPVFSTDSLKYRVTITAPHCKPESWDFAYSFSVVEYLREVWKFKYCKPNLMEDLMGLISLY
jgi:hypothetical protein